jgi:hypothetical protein
MSRTASDHIVPDTEPCPLQQVSVTLATFRSLRLERNADMGRRNLRHLNNLVSREYLNHCLQTTMSIQYPVAVLMKHQVANNNPTAEVRKGQVGVDTRRRV